MSSQPNPRATVRAIAGRRPFAGVDEATWAKLEPLIPDPPRTGRRSGRMGRRSVGNRAVINSLILMGTRGCGFESVHAEPGHLASGMTCWRRVAYWRQMGAWPAISAVLATVPGVDVTRFERRAGHRPQPPAAEAGPQ